MIGLFFAALLHVVQPVDAILTDIEGTTTSISFVHDTLFPYAKQHMDSYIADHQYDPAVRVILEEVQNQAHVSPEGVVPTLLQWMEQDKKITSLKALQGLMWEDGYRQGAFKGHVYNDAYLQLVQWKNQGISLYVYSSGSVHAQKLLFTYSDHGDMSMFFSGHFDARVGGKRESSSYRNIAKQIGIVSDRILFLSDTVEELNAAREAGMQTILLTREVTPAQDYGHPCVANFNEISLQ